MRWKRRLVILLAVFVALPGFAAVNSPVPTGSVAADPELSGRWALIIGNTEYRNPAITDLNLSGADATLIAELLVKCCAFRDDQVIHLSSASFLDIISSFHQLEMKLAHQREDFPDLDQLVVVYYSGHGATVRNGDATVGAIIPSDTVPDILASTAIDEVLLNLLFDRFRPATVLAIFDCGQMGVQGLAAPGRLVLTASSKDQCSWEEDFLGHGVFTYNLVKGLRKGDTDGDERMSLQEAFYYAAEETVEHGRISNFRQEPEIADGIGEPLFLVTDVSSCPELVLESKIGGLIVKPEGKE